MGVFVGSVVLHVSDSDRAAAFWSTALGYAPKPENPEFLAPQGGGPGPRLHLDRSDSTHLDLWVDRQDSDLRTEVERLIALGAKRADWVYPADADFVVLVDTEGNLFCVIE